MPHQRSSRRRITALVGAAAGLAVPIPLATPAAAHDRLVSSTPGEGATVEVVPAAVQLTMSAQLVALGAQVQVSGPSGVVSTGEAQVAGTDVTQALISAAPAGAYEVQWRVTFSDGHLISGSFAFTATAASTAPTPTAPADASSSETDAAAEPANDAAASTGSSADSSADWGQWAPVVLAALAGAIAGTVLVVIRRRRRG